MGFRWTDPLSIGHLCCTFVCFEIVGVYDFQGNLWRGGNNSKLIAYKNKFYIKTFENETHENIAMILSHVFTFSHTLKHLSIAWHPSYVWTQVGVISVCSILIHLTLIGSTSIWKLLRVVFTFLFIFPWKMENTSLTLTQTQLMGFVHSV